MDAAPRLISLCALPSARQPLRIGCLELHLDITALFRLREAIGDWRERDHVPQPDDRSLVAGCHCILRALSHGNPTIPAGLDDGCPSHWHVLVSELGRDPAHCEPITAMAFTRANAALVLTAVEATSRTPFTGPPIDDSVLRLALRKLDRPHDPPVAARYDYEV